MSSVRSESEVAGTRIRPAPSRASPGWAIYMPLGAVQLGPSTAGVAVAIEPMPRTAESPTVFCDIGDSR